MTELKTAPYGSWKSPITSDLIVKESLALGQVRMHGDDIYWIEMRPSEGGRQVIVRHTADRTVDVTPPGFNARTRVHEYGGGDYLVSGATVYFSNFADQRLYRQPLNSESAPQPISEENTDGRLRYADAIADNSRKRLICVREDHRQQGREAVNELVAVSTDDGPEELVLVSGNDFYSSPRLSPDGSRLAWLTWNHPNMPWDGCELWVGELTANGAVENQRRVAGGIAESIFQPEWSPDGVLYFVSDRSGWWNIYRGADGGAEYVCEMEAEFGAAQWIFGLSTYAFESADRIICAFAERGIWHLGTIDTRTRALERIDTHYTEVSFVSSAPGRAVFRAGSRVEPLSVIDFDLTTNEAKVLQRQSNIRVDPDYFSKSEIIEFPTEQGLTAYGFFYPPTNRDFTAPPGEKPPLLVKSHGGPTSATIAVPNMINSQYWTSRGIAVLDVNYGGSTGYGRAYRERLNSNWGIVDVDDCVNGAKFLALSGKVDGNRSMIDGGSAGGYTTLCALTFRDYFKAGASHFGVSDLEALDEDTHKFESRYSHYLIGPYPERRDLYIERSPVHFADRLSCPVIFFQGLEDKIVPPNQAEMMVEALRRKGLPVAYVAFAGEQHGFRRAENIKRSLDGELYFYARVFGFELAEPVEPVAIENL
jgi:dipeptidyl aminopeptidase/acylaminoacyl peptidase